MVTEWVLSMFASLVETLFGSISLPAVPGWVTDAPTAVDAVGSYVSGLGAWIPWAVVAGVFATWAVVLLAGVGFRVFRMALSHIPFVGGSG